MLLWVIVRQARHLKIGCCCYYNYLLILYAGVASVARVATGVVYDYLTYICRGRYNAAVGVTCTARVTYRTVAVAPPGRGV